MSDRRPGLYELLSFKVTDYTNSKSVEIAHLIPRFEFTESMDNTTMRGTARVVDSVGLLDDFPLIGEETITIRYRDVFGAEREHEFFLFAVDGIEPNTQGNYVSYRIYFVSKEKIISDSLVVRKSYNGLISRMVGELFFEYLESDKTLTIEDTTGPQRLVVPAFTPLKALQMFARKAYSVEHQSSDFYFFENRDGFFFVTYEELVRRAKARNEPYLNFTYNPAVLEDFTDLESKMLNVEKIVQGERADTVKDIKSGAYKNRVMDIDLLYKTVANTDYDYYENFDNYEHLDKFPLRKHTEEFKRDRLDSASDAVTFMTIKDFFNDERINQSSQNRPRPFYPEIISHRTAARYHLNNTVIETTVYGRNDLVTGDVISLVIPEFHVSTNQRKINKFISGNYLVTEINHTFIHNDYKMRMKLVKDNMRGDLTDILQSDKGISI